MKNDTLDIKKIFNVSVDMDMEKKYERAEGREEKAREIARRMIIDGMPLEKVLRMTGLSGEQK